VLHQVIRLEGSVYQCFQHHFSAVGENYCHKLNFRATAQSYLSGQCEFAGRKSRLKSNSFLKHFSQYTPFLRSP